MSCCKVADDKAVSDVKRSRQFQNLNDEKRCTSGGDKRWWTSCNIVVGDSRSLNTGNMVQKDASKDSFLMAGRNAGLAKWSGGFDWYCWSVSCSCCLLGCSDPVHFSVYARSTLFIFVSI
ncbi:PREDICTED: calcium-transporting ATPase 8, plasma membrane-type-like isoform X1 [Tarenaya hassleriana]|uniref:calcium-transporting ATPase 8, plasma membrane-type-like isoform X1 n=1 Tax=Tarenaya hassleriana TaxID=28532 RepID=UPI0008FD0D20|nr:PREDICTED: calcium-transporting ATPase 8, plasma membrane-type-like isoform X1 [Tarenaya hassleriana]